MRAHRWLQPGKKVEKFSSSNGSNGSCSDRRETGDRRIGLDGRRRDGGMSVCVVNRGRG